MIITILIEIIFSNNKLFISRDGRTGDYVGTIQQDAIRNIIGSTAEAQIYYTTDGSIPTSLSTLYTIPIIAGLSGTLNIKAIAIVDDGVNEFLSNVLVSSLDILSTPVASVTSGWLNYNNTVTLTTTTPSSSIYYTLNGTTPTISSTLYTNSIPITRTLTLKAVTVVSGHYSGILTENYLVVATPISSPNDSSDIILGTLIYLATTTIDGTVEIYYTLDGGTPTNADTLYTVPIEMNTIGNITLKAITTKDGIYLSNILIQYYTVVIYKVSGFINLNGLVTDVTTVSIQLQQNGNNVGSPIHPDIDGFYIFENLFPDTDYQVIATLSGWDSVNSSLFDIIDDDIILETLSIFAGRFVLVGNGTTYYSNDGINWVNLPPNGIQGSNTIDMIFTNGAYIALCGSLYHYSIDGINFSGSLSIDSLFNPWAIYYGDGKFVVVCPSDAAYTTDPTGKTGWIGVPFPLSAYIPHMTYRIAYGNNKFITIQSANELTAYSDDGMNWYLGTPLPNAITGWKSITYGDDKFVVINSDQDLITYSDDDGTTWNSILPALLSPGEYWSKVIYANDMFIAISQGQTGAYSYDGVDWTSFNLPYNQDWSDVVFGNGKFIAVSSNYTDQAAQSIDGINWIPFILPELNQYYYILYNN
ncbi:MAG: chitobiase/beta-hexosaminidase C-terminal domain-containing protein [Spirochaetes bacterium]|nr:chitobiase/beta-hexosaminidase C-terminal domain-containing protein [Spirochaetota bacterium]